MADPSIDVEIKVSTEVAERFVTDFYKALNVDKLRQTLSTFYIHPTPSNPLTADISLNGNIVPSPEDVQKLFELTIRQAHYEVQSYDCHVVNPNYNIGASDSDLGPDATGRKMSLLVIVSGYVKYGEPKEAMMRGFTENFVLVPNFEVGLGNAKRPRSWLIQSQNFRLVF